MPNFDGTGPEGKGPKTGMQRGNCEGVKPRQGTMGRNRVSGLGRNAGQGLSRKGNCPRGRRFRNKN